MNEHLNLFRFFNENDNIEYIENNVSRALAICLINNSILLNEFIRSIVTQEDYEYLFSSIGSGSTFSINLQVNTSTIDTEEYNTVYAVAITACENLDMSDFFENKIFLKKLNITDIYISLKDIAIIIEVKLTTEDCREQLFNQITPFLKGESKKRVEPRSYSWQTAINMFERTNNLQKLTSIDSIFISDFLRLSEQRFPEWFGPKPFKSCAFSSQVGTANHTTLIKRMSQILSNCVQIAGDGYEVGNYADRLSIKLPFPWANEICPEFETSPEGVENVVFYIWPGNTKGQGRTIYNAANPLKWLSQTVLLIGNVPYQLMISYNIKLSHFNGHVASCSFTDGDVRMRLHTPDNYTHNSGQWKRASWTEFEQLLDDHFKADYHWREKCEWENKFINTDRGYFTMSLGFEVSIRIPFSAFKEIDANLNDIGTVSAFICQIVNAFHNLIPD